MKKFTEWVGVIREAEERQMSELQKSYKDYFGAKLNKFGAKSPADLTEDQKKEFFNEIKKDWEKGQGATPAGKADVEKHGVNESEDVNEGDKDFKTGMKVKTEDGEDGVITKIHYGGTLIDIKVGSKTMTVSRSVLTVNESEEIDLNEGVFYRLPKATIANELRSTTMNLEKFFNHISAGADVDPNVLDSIIKSLDKVKKELKKFTSTEEVKGTVYESEEVNEADVKNAKDFEEYAMAILKKEHGDDFDEAKAKKIIDGLSVEAEKSGDWGAAVGKLQNG